MGSGHADTSVANPFAQLYGDKIPIQEALIGLQGGYNWQLPNTRWVFGAEGELTFLDTAGANTCFAKDAFYLSIQLHQRSDRTWHAGCAPWLCGGTDRQEPALS